MAYYVFFNPLAGNKTAEKKMELLPLPQTSEILYQDITKIENMKEFLSNLNKDDKIILCGGDGTLNHFINDIDDGEIENDVLLFAAGSGNDFLNDIEENPHHLVKINKYIKDLPILTVNGKAFRFINNVGFGIDGYCCAEAAEKRKKSDKPVNYTAIALKGLAFAFKPVNATVYTDGKEYKYKKVWMAPTMKGRYFGGGMLMAPFQDRDNAENSVALMVIHDLSTLKILSIFPLIFKGRHMQEKYMKHIAVFPAHDIKVVFDKPCSLQLDGEAILGVTEYSVLAPKKEKVNI